MKQVQFLALTALAFLLPANKAFAFNFGFVRVPNWMDFYIVCLLATSLVSFAGLAVTKPSDVAFNELPQIQISPVANLFRCLMVISFGLTMMMVFVGMGLRRYAEAYPS